MQIYSSQFKHNEILPAPYTCDGRDISPPLFWIDVPEGTKSLALIVDDPDASRGAFVHWMMWNLPATSTGLPEAVPKLEKLPDGSIQGISDFGRVGYDGPCPPTGKHRYFFKLYALDRILDLGSHAKKIDLENAIRGHIIAKSEMIGIYQRRE